MADDNPNNKDKAFKFLDKLSSSFYLDYELNNNSKNNGAGKSW